MVAVQEGKKQKAIASVRKACEGYSVKFSGNAADQATSQELVIGETVRAIIMLIPILIIILILVTNSFVEPVFYLLTLRASILLNLGSNIVFGEISFVTLAAAPVLQLTVSLDYTVFLSHSYDQYKQAGVKPEVAVKMAMKASSKSISTSMLTTMFGLIALLFMQFKIGADRESVW